MGSYFPSSLAWSIFRTSFCLMSDNGSLTSCMMTRPCGVTAFTTPSNSLSFARTRNVCFRGPAPWPRIRPGHQNAAHRELVHRESGDAVGGFARARHALLVAVLDQADERVPAAFRVVGERVASSGGPWAVRGAARRACGRRWRLRRGAATAAREHDEEEQEWSHVSSPSSLAHAGVLAPAPAPPRRALPRARRSSPRTRR